jgi:hypothetical protein
MIFLDAEASRRAIPDLKQLYSVYVGHLPNDITQVISVSSI